MIVKSLFVLLTAASLSFTTDPGKSCHESKKAKCTGSAYCSACKNCKYCKHCNAGGTCGVCKPSKKKKG